MYAMVMIFILYSADVMAMEDRSSTGFWQKLRSLVKLNYQSKNSRCYLGRLPEEIQRSILEFIEYECDEKFINRTKESVQGKMGFTSDNRMRHCYQSGLSDFYDTLFCFSRLGRKVVVVGDGVNETSGSLSILRTAKGTKKEYALSCKIEFDECIAVAVSDARQCSIDADVARVLRIGDKFFLLLTNSDRDEHKKAKLSLQSPPISCAFNKQGNKVIVHDSKKKFEIVSLCSNHTESKFKKTLLDYCQERGICKAWPTE